MDAKTIIAAIFMLISVCCTVFLLSAVPLFGKQFVKWPLLAARLWSVSLSVLPVTVILSLILSIHITIFGRQRVIGIILLIIAVCAILFYMAYVAAFTSGP